jgi:hypothetical protein
MKFFKLLKASIRWTKTGTVILSALLLVFFIIGYVWWPLLEEYAGYFDPDVPFWKQIDWLLIGDFLVMSILIVLNADLRHDIPFLLIALAGGYIIEAWGTLSGLWTYYTFETPPLWIIPAWPIAALSVNRMYDIIGGISGKISGKWTRWVYWLVFSAFYILLLDFVWPTLSHPLTIFALVVCAVVILTTRDQPSALIIFLVGSALGYFLERWGTTRLCWAYYTGGMPPFFTVIAHGMASVGVWWVYEGFLALVKRIGEKRLSPDIS